MGPVLLMDANMSAPTLHTLFKQNDKVGLMDLLVGSSTPEEAIQTTSIDSLHLLPFGSKESVRNGRIVPENYGDIVAWIRDRYRTVFVDLPTIESMRHSLFLARLIDMTIVAVRSEAVRRSDLTTAIHRMTDDGVSIGGTILTRRRIYTPRWLRNA
jgi:Mrp family chromosome partitioning ATPase